MYSELNSQTSSRPTPTTAAHRRRRHLSVYHRALRTAKTPQQRAAVAARYRKLFAAGAGAPVQPRIVEESIAEPIHLPVAPRDVVRLAS